MKNKIIYGPAATGKTLNYFNSTISSWNGKVIAMASCNSLKDEKISVYPLDEEYISKIESDNKILFERTINEQQFLVDKAISSLSKELNSNSFDKPLLLAIDGFEKLHFSNEKLLLESLENDRISVMIILQDIKYLNKIFKSNYNDILNLCEVICTKTDYSGDLRVRFPKSLHKDLKEAADKEGISLNQYIIYILTKNFYSEISHKK